MYFLVDSIFGIGTSITTNIVHKINKNLAIYKSALQRYELYFLEI